MRRVQSCYCVEMASIFTAHETTEPLLGHSKSALCIFTIGPARSTTSSDSRNCCAPLCDVGPVVSVKVPSLHGSSAVMLSRHFVRVACTPQLHGFWTAQVSLDDDIHPTPSCTGNEMWASCKIIVILLGGMPAAEFRAAARLCPTHLSIPIPLHNRCIEPIVARAEIKVSLVGQQKEFSLFAPGPRVFEYHVMLTFVFFAGPRVLAAGLSHLEAQLENVNTRRATLQSGVERVWVH
jgi:hypothetical protein